MADLYAQIQQLEAQLNTLRTRRDALEATTDKLVDTRMVVVRDTGPIYEALRNARLTLLPFE